MRTTPEGKYCVGSLGRKTMEPVLEAYSRSLVKLAELVETFPADIDVQIRRYSGLVSNDAGWIVWTTDPIRVRAIIADVVDSCYDAYAKGKI